MRRAAVALSLVRLAHADDCNGNAIDDSLEVAGAIRIDRELRSFRANIAAIKLVAGDIDGDGDNDIVLQSFYSPGVSEFNVSFNDGDGQFDESRDFGDTNRIPNGLALGDFDNDGDLDVAVSGDGYFDDGCQCTLNNGIAVFANRGDGVFDRTLYNAISESWPIGVVAGDINGDGYSDLIAAYAYKPGFEVFFNDRKGRFESQQFIASDSIGVPVVGDVNGDGALDVVQFYPSYMESRPVVVSLGDGAGRFKSMAVIDNPGYIADLGLVDLDNDGDLDMVIANYGYGLRLFANAWGGDYFWARNWDGERTDCARFLTRDFNQDGWDDLAVTSVDSYDDNCRCWRSRFTLYAGGPGGEITEVDEFRLPGDSVPMCLVDVEGDGDNDFAFSRYEYPGYLDVLRNESVRKTPDCNGNSIPDECDLADGSSNDEFPAGGDDIPDECQADCNSNGVPDDVDVRSGTSMDCNLNAVPDECDVAAGRERDCNQDGVVDRCQGFGPFDGFDIAFDGVNDRIDIPANSKLKLTSTLTLEMWLKPDSPNHDGPAVLYSKPGECVVGYAHDGSILWYFGIDDRSWGWYLTKAIAPQGAWTHLAITYANGSVRTFINGEVVDTFDRGDEIVDQDSFHDEVTVGNRTTDPSPFRGQLSDLRLWKIARSPNEIRADYERRIEGKPSGLVGYWPLNDGTGTTATEKINRIHGKLQLGPKWTKIHRAPGCMLADVNCDGAVDADDIDGFVLAIIERDEYERAYPACHYFLADVNADGVVDFNDIDRFVECLISDGCS